MNFVLTKEQETLEKGHKFPPYINSVFCNFSINVFF